MNDFVLALSWHTGHVVGMAVIGVLFVAGCVLVVRELRLQWRNYKIANRPNRAPGFIYDRDDERLPL